MRFRRRDLFATAASAAAVFAALPNDAAAQLLMSGVGAGSLSGGGGVTPASFINAGSRQIASASDSFSFPAGASSGDLLLIMVLNNTGLVGLSASTAKGAMTSVCSVTGLGAGSYVLEVFYTIVNSTDLSSPSITLANASTFGSVGMGIYRGASVATYTGVSAASLGSASTLVFSGFSTSGVSKGVVAMISDRDTGASTITGSPATWAARLNVGNAFFSQVIQDVLGGYTNATNTFSGFVATNPQVGVLVELT
jgi:hypothetical protein